MTLRSNRKLVRRGAAVVETALVVAIVILFLFGIMEFGRLTMMRQIVENACRDGCRMAAVECGQFPNAQVVSDVRNQVDKFIPPAANRQLRDFVVNTNPWVKDNGFAPDDLLHANVCVFCSKPDGTFTVFVDPSANPPRLGAVTEARFGDNVAVQVQANFRPILPNFIFGGQSVLIIRSRVQMWSEAGAG